QIQDAVVSADVRPAGAVVSSASQAVPSVRHDNRQRRPRDDSGRRGGIIQADSVVRGHQPTGDSSISTLTGFRQRLVDSSRRGPFLHWPSTCSRGPATRRHSMSTITVNDGTTIYYKDWGKGPVVTFSHGWPLNADAWDGQMLYLEQQGF